MSTHAGVLLSPLLLSIYLVYRRIYRYVHPCGTTSDPSSRVTGIRNAEEDEWTATAPAIFWECKEFLKMPLMIIALIIIEHLEIVKEHLEVASDHLKPL